MVASVFVNPLQFAPGEDLDRYPRTPRRPTSRLCAARAPDVVFVPEVDEVYPEGLDGGVTRRPRPARHGARGRGAAHPLPRACSRWWPSCSAWCDRTRPWFGEKDYQQLVLIRRMARELVPAGATCVGAPIVREADGLALSSRNAYLDADQRRDRRWRCRGRWRPGARRRGRRRRRRSGRPGRGGRAGAGAGRRDRLRGASPTPSSDPAPAPARPGCWSPAGSAAPGCSTTRAARCSSAPRTARLTPCCSASTSATATPSSACSTASGSSTRLAGDDRGAAHRRRVVRAAARPASRGADPATRGGLDRQPGLPDHRHRGLLDRADGAARGPTGAGALLRRRAAPGRRGRRAHRCAGA